ncbi:transcription factor PAP1, partial [Ascoidea rubescens DSM 1968]
NDVNNNNNNNNNNDDDDDNDVVPSNDHDLLKCSEVWDRITSHPKYSDLDIDGLCNELRLKAKCSEKGVVVSSNDLNNIMNREASPSL